MRIEDGKYDKPVIVFNDGKKLGLNRTNTKILVKAFGRESTDWLGKSVELFLGNVEFQGREFGCVLINPALKN